MNEENKPNIILEKSFAFSVRIVKLYKWFYKNHSEVLPLAKQLLRSGTSIGANAEEADGAYSKKEFSAKFGICLKEAKETKYWIRLLYASEFLDENMYLSLKYDIEELIKIITAILKSSREG